MNTDNTQIRVRGKTFDVPSVEIDGRTVVVTGRWLKIASIKDESVVQGEPVRDPGSFVARLKEAKLKPDLFTFSQRPPNLVPAFDYPYEWDNLAAIPIDSFDDWWTKRLPQESRKNVRRAGKRGVVAKVVSFDDELVRGIHKIYADTPIRQGRRFWHFGKDFETVKREHATYLERSEFVGAYFEDQLIGFIKMVYVDQMATLFQIFAKEEHHDKRPMNALVAKAVEVCAAKQMKYLVYGKYTYGNKTNSPLAEFKRRNGFEQVNYPKYYVPLTLTGRLALKLKLHRGLLGILPPNLLMFLVGVRRKTVQTVRRVFTKAKPRTPEPPKEEGGTAEQHAIAKSAVQTQD